ncbi:MAG: hypothetical protein RL385_5704, partial [Pseudomonadota bacterium]
MDRVATRRSLSGAHTPKSDMLSTQSLLRASVPIAAFLLSHAAAPASIVSADCLAPAPAVLWTYPANGDVDVPTDSSLWLAANVSSFGQVPTVELNGTAVSVQAESLSALAPLRFEPPTLAPDTSYVWTLRYPPTDGQSATTFEVQFKTGKRQRRAAPKVRVVAHAEHDVA